MKVLSCLILLQQFLLFANFVSLQAQFVPKSYTYDTLTTTMTNSEVIVESPHNYVSSMKYFSENIVLGSGGYVGYSVQFHPDSETEQDYDFVKIHKGSSNDTVVYSVSGWNFPSEVIYSDVGITFELVSDEIVADYGFRCTVSLVSPTIRTFNILADNSRSYDRDSCLDENTPLCNLASAFLCCSEFIEDTMGSAGCEFHLPIDGSGNPPKKVFY